MPEETRHGKRADPRGRPVVIVAGPTASGKSALALDIAEAFEGTIINADALQVYEGLPRLTAQPDAAAMARVPHRLYGVLAPEEACSAGRWRDLALTAIEEALAEGRLPVLAGGTGLYIKALTEGLSRVPPVPEAERAKWRAHMEAVGPERFHGELEALDPEMAARLSPRDRQRLVRAREVLAATGRSLAHWQRQKDSPAPYRFLAIILMPPRGALYAAIDRRFEAMVEAGALEEVRALLERGLDRQAPAMKAIGVRELVAHLTGETDLDDAMAAAQQASRRYAKRQATWLRTQGLGKDLTSMVLESQYSESMRQKIFAKIREFILTES